MPPDVVVAPTPGHYDRSSASGATTSRDSATGAHGRRPQSSQQTWLAVHEAVPDLTRAAPWLVKGQSPVPPVAVGSPDDAHTYLGHTTSQRSMQDGVASVGSPSQEQEHGQLQQRQGLHSRSHRRSSWLAVHDAVPDMERVAPWLAHSQQDAASYRTSRPDRSSAATSLAVGREDHAASNNPTYGGPLHAATDASDALSRCSRDTRATTEDRHSNGSAKARSQHLVASVKTAGNKLMAWIAGANGGAGGRPAGSLFTAPASPGPGSAPVAIPTPKQGSCTMVCVEEPQPFTPVTQSPVRDGTAWCSRESSKSLTWRDGKHIARQAVAEQRAGSSSPGAQEQFCEPLAGRNPSSRVSMTSILSSRALDGEYESSPKLLPVQGPFSPRQGLGTHIEDAQLPGSFRSLDRGLAASGRWRVPVPDPLAPPAQSPSCTMQEQLPNQVMD